MTEEEQPEYRLCDIDQHYFPQNDIADHEVFLSFNSDVDAMNFRDWLDDNWENFRTYNRSQR